MSTQDSPSNVSRNILPTKDIILSGTPFVLIATKLGGEMGNHLFRIANGQCVKHLVEERLGLQTKFFIVINNQKTVEPTRQAFPNVDLHMADKKTVQDIEKARKLQAKWITELISNNRLDLTNVQVPTILSERFCSLRHCYDDLLNLLNQLLRMDVRPTAPIGDTNITLPLVYVDKFIDDYCWDLMSDKFQPFFKIDEDSICNQVPDPDESVFHLRNYRTEVSSETILKHGFQEADPTIAAEVLFADSKPGDKVAIVSRFQNHTDEYIKAFRDIKGIKARYIQGQTGPQDFCFVYKAQKELVVSARSTFGTWAAFFGEAKRGRIYCLSTNAARASGVDVMYNPFSSKELQDRLSFENYNTTWWKAAFWLMNIWRLWELSTLKPGKQKCDHPGALVVLKC
eukprot:scaffold2253_cov119-Cylindrotheca_fusiformis.AAC.9